MEKIFGFFKFTSYLNINNYRILIKILLSLLHKFELIKLFKFDYNKQQIYSLFKIVINKR